jgi:hypothetical protein
MENMHAAVVAERMVAYKDNFHADIYAKIVPGYAQVCDGRTGTGKTREKFPLKAKGMDALAGPIPTPLRGNGCGSHGPRAALGMTENCHECR